MQSATANTPEPPVEGEVARIRGLMEAGRFEPALAAAASLARRVPENRDVLYMLAVCQRYLHRIPEALATLVQLQEVHPRFSRLYQERGHCYVALRDAPHAIEAFLQAVNMNPALPASWRTLQALYRLTGNMKDAETAGAHMDTLARLPAEVVTANGMFADGELALAEQLIRSFLLKHGDNIEAMRLLARIGMELDVLDDAEVLLEAVLRLAPDYDAARHDYASTLLRRYKPVQAIEELDKLIRRQPDNRQFRTTYANAVVGLGDHERALALYRELLPSSGQPAEVHLSIAHSLKTLGRQAEAVDAYRASAAARLNYGDAYWSLANLKTYRFTDAEIEQMRAEESSKRTQQTDRYHLCFALGKALEDRGDFAASFAYYARGNALKKSEIRYRPEPIERNTRLQKQICTQDFFAQRQGWGSPRPDPIFIIGLPRSGSTLIEQILASHSQVEGTMELAEIPRLVHQLSGRENYADEPRYPQALGKLSADEVLKYGEAYLANTTIYRTGKPFFIDKMPNNFRHLGLIHLILPRAKIIDARREPMACCFSNFKQLFANGQEFTYSLEDIGRYYRTYLELMAHWDAVLPGRVLRVQHEDLVEDLEGHVRRLLEFCELPFEPACLEFYRTERSVRTASSEQVRQPIFKEGLDQWRNFEPWLGPLREVLAAPVS
ncbi:MAG TPA: sulfotransferase [Steroidobacteraceae bacterium]|nr:sulfotransferase [Steroidobacteraceae bacterium]